MKLLIVNPNTTQSMTDTMLAAATAVVQPGTQIIGATAQSGPESIEGYYDEVFSIPPMIQAVQQHKDVDAIVVGCFDDTGVDALRCATAAPVIGLCQAAMQAASVVSGSFSVVTTLSRSIPALEHLALRYGYERICKRIRASEVPVLDLETGKKDALDKIRREIALAISEDRAEAIVLGCAGMADLASDLSKEFGLPVVEGVTAASKCVESLVTLNLSTSRLGGYAPPRVKAYKGGYGQPN